MVQKIFRKRHTTVGARPGTLVIDEQAAPPSVQVFAYREGGVEERGFDHLEELQGLLQEHTRLWIDVRGLGNEELLRGLGRLLGMHPLALEDVVNVPQRPKVESYEEHLLIVTRMVRLSDTLELDSEQVSILVGRRYVVTFQERPGDLFDPIRVRLREGKGPIRRLGSDYLAYAILDSVIDGYYPVLERFGEYLERLEDFIVETPVPSILRDIHRVKRDLLALRRAIWPQREVVNSLIRDELTFISEKTHVYLRDCYDHCVQIMDAVESYRELAGGLMEVYLSSVGNRQNEVMKVLTIMASIFIPLTFLAGIYGMNFENMPELRSAWGYPLLLLTMILTGAGMYLYFRRRGWIGPPDVPAEDRLPPRSE